MKKLLTIALMMTAMTGAAIAQTATVQVIHNSPDPAAAMVDVYINDEIAIPDFEFLNATPVIELPAETELVIGVAPGNSAGPEDIIATFPVTLMDGESYVVMATGVLDGSLPGNPDGEDTAFTLKVFAPQTSSAMTGEVEALVYHGSPSAPTVDVQVPGVGVLVDDLTYGMFDGYLTAPAVDLVLEITPGGDNDTVVAAFEAPLSLLDGLGVVVFAAGFFGDYPHLPEFGLYVALPDGTVVTLHPSSVATEVTNWSDVKSQF
ncbi:DUF4397 domain-containing protein [bacterium]|nr:DUF4397 domain-containing protein [bacterium]